MEQRAPGDQPADKHFLFFCRQALVFTCLLQCSDRIYARDYGHSAPNGSASVSIDYADLRHLVLGVGVGGRFRCYLSRLKTRIHFYFACNWRIARKRSYIVVQHMEGACSGRASHWNSPVTPQKHAYSQKHGWHDSDEQKHGTAASYSCTTNERTTRQARNCKTKRNAHRYSKYISKQSML